MTDQIADSAPVALDEEEIAPIQSGLYIVPGTDIRINAWSGPTSDLAAKGFNPQPTPPPHTMKFR